MDVSETIVVYENGYMNLYEYQRSFIDLGPMSLIFNIFKLYFLRMEPPRDGGTKVCSNGLGHKTIMAAMHICGKKLTQTSSLKPKSRLPWKLVRSFGYSSTTKFVDLDLFYGKVKFVPLCFCMGKGKTMNFSETIVVCDIKVGRCSQLNEDMNLYECQRSGSFTDLRRRSLRFNIFKLHFLKNR